jgi:hypothetical protein
MQAQYSTLQSLICAICRAALFFTWHTAAKIDSLRSQKGFVGNGGEYAHNFRI